MPLDFAEFERTLAAAISALRAGRPVLVADNRDRENEVDAIAAAQDMTEQVLAWMIRHTSGYICAPMTAARADELKLPHMVVNNQDPRRTNYMVTCDAASGVTTGISAHDRARTLRVLADPQSTATSLIRPGHTVPLVAQPGGVLTRGGHTEASLDLCRLAGLTQVAAISELVNDDGTMMRYEQAEKFATAEDLVLLTVDDLVAWREVNDRDGLSELSETATAQVAQSAETASSEGAYKTRLTRIAEAKLPTEYGGFQVVCFRDERTGYDHLALIADKPAESQTDPLVRVHSECLTGEAFGSLRCDCGPQLHAAMRAVTEQGGAIIYLRGQEGRGIGLAEKIRAYRLQDEGMDTAEANIELGWPVDMRDYRVAAEILDELGMRRIRLLTNNPEKRRLDSDLVQVSETLPLEVGITAENVDYLRTKQAMGHTFTTLPPLDEQE